MIVSIHFKWLIYRSSWYFFSLQEFLDTVVLFSTPGRSDDKLRIVFDMCDSNENGLIDKGELQEMLTSLVEMAKTEKVDLINSLE